MGIVVSGVPNSVRKPGVFTDYDLTNAISGVAANQYKLALIGASGTGWATGGANANGGTYALADTVYPILDSAQAETLFGADSSLARMVKDAFSVNPYIPLFAIIKNATIATTLAKLTTDQYHVLAFDSVPIAADATAINNHLTLVSGPIEQRPAIAVFGFVGDVTGAKAAATFFMSDRVSVVAVKADPCTAAATVTPELHLNCGRLAAAYAAALAASTDPAMPLNGVALTGLPAVQVKDNWTRTEQEALMGTATSGAVTPIENVAGGVMAIVRAVSTKTTGVSGTSPDLWIRILDYVRYALGEVLGEQFSRSKLNDRVVSMVKATIYDTLLKIEELEIIEHVAFYKDRLQVERDANIPGRLNARIPVDVVNGLHVMANVIELHI